MPYSIKFWYPSNVAEGSATYSVTLKAPEIGNTAQLARNQQMVRTRTGRTLVYDRGRNINELMRLQFRDITDSERSALVVFLDLVTWGAAKLKYKDYLGTEKIVRIMSNQIEYEDNGPIQKALTINSCNQLLWNFSLEVLDLTNSPEAYEVDSIMANALSLHIANFDHPHNPLTNVTVNIADGNKVIETLLVDTWSIAHWVIDLENGAIRKSCIVSVAHDGTSLTDATTVDYSEAVSAAIGDSSPVTLSVDLSSSGVTQTMRLKCQVTTNGWRIKCRRIKV